MPAFFFIILMIGFAVTLLKPIPDVQAVNPARTYALVLSSAHNVARVQILGSVVPQPGIDETRVMSCGTRATGLASWYARDNELRQASEIIAALGDTGEPASYGIAGGGVVVSRDGRRFVLPCAIPDGAPVLLTAFF